MASLAVRSTPDPVVALDSGRAFLAAHPEHNSIILTVLAERVARHEEGRFWWAWRDSEVVGFAMQSPAGFRAVLAPAGRGAVEALADAMAVDAPDLPGVMAEAATATAFAGRWAEVRGVAVLPVEAQRLHRIRTVRPPEGVPGALRPAEPTDRPVLLGWTVAFLRDTGSSPFDPGSLVDRHMTSGRLWLWEVDGTPVSMAAASAAAESVARVAFVYTPLEHRRRGYAAACVAAVSEHLLGHGVGCILHTQLHNPTSNGVYRRIGYEPVTEILVYRFG